MQRRDFLKSVGVLAGVAAVPGAALASTKKHGGFTPRTEPSSIVFKPTNTQREQLVAQTLRTKEGRQALAEAMKLPIDRQLECYSLPRKFLKKTDDKNIKDFTKISGAATELIRLSELGFPGTMNSRIFYLIDRCQLKMQQSLLMSEDKGFMNVIEDSKPFITSEYGKKSFRYFIQAIKHMGCSEKEAKTIIMNPTECAEIYNAGLFDNQPKHRNCKIEGLEIKISYICKKGTIYFLPAPEHLGEIIVNRNVEVTSNDECKNLRIGWKAEEDVRIKINPRTVSKLILY